MSYLKVGAAVGFVLALLVVSWRIDSWRERAAELNRVQAEYAAYRAGITKDLAERERQERIDREITSSYIVVMQKQDADLAAARAQLRNVRLRVGACPQSVPTTPTAAAAAAGAPAEGPDKSSRLVDASAIAERFAACDGVAARLNALIDWHERATR